MLVDIVVQARWGGDLIAGWGPFDFADFADFADLADIPLVDVVVVVVVDVVVVVVVDMVVVAVVAVVAVDAVVVVVVVVDFEFGPALRTIMASAIPSAGARDLLPSAKMLANSVSVG